MAIKVRMAIHTISIHSSRSSTMFNKARKKKPEIYRLERNTMTLFSDDIIAYMEILINPKKESILMLIQQSRG
jgi:hypothetical protein